MTQLIYAKASGIGISAVSVFRVSGDGALSLGEKLTGRVLRPRFAHFAKISKSDGSTLDEALVIGFAKGASFTGEEIIEIQTHGSRAVESALIDRLEELGCKLADQGEFTRRALENEKLDRDLLLIRQHTSASRVSIVAHPKSRRASPGRKPEGRSDPCDARSCPAHQGRSSCARRCLRWDAL